MLAFVFSLAGGLGGALYVLPWQAGNPYLTLLRLRSPALYAGLELTYYLLWVSSTWLMLRVCLRTRSRMQKKSLQRVQEQPGHLPAYPNPATRGTLEVILGEVHHQKRVGVPSATPVWESIPRMGLFTGTMVFGSTGSGKTMTVLLPTADQVLGWKPYDREKRIGGLALEVKGTFCDQIHDVLKKYGREEDYVELRPGGPVKYNPIDRALSASAIASTINALMVSIHGEERDSYWGKVTQEAIKNIVLLFRRLQNGHCTLHNILLALGDTEFLGQKLQEEIDKHGAGTESLIVSLDEYVKPGRDLEKQGFAIEHGELRAPYSKELHEWLTAKDIPYEVELLIDKKQDRELASIVRWFKRAWMKLEPRIRSSVITGITPFLSLFDSDHNLLETFCPPPDAEGLFLGWQETIELGKVVAVKFDTTDPDMGRLLGVFIKQAYQRAVLQRIPAMKRHLERYFRETLLIVDECHEMLTVGLKHPVGDEKFLAKSREALCIAVFATQSVSSLRSALLGDVAWKTILGNLKTKIFLHQEDIDTAEYASKLCGKENQWIPHVSLGESGQDTRVGVLGDKAVAAKSSVSATKGYNEQLRPLFEPHVFLNLKNGQAIARVYDGQQTATTVLYLKHYVFPIEQTWFEQNGV